MKKITLGMSLLVGGLLAVASVQAQHPHGEHPSHESEAKPAPQTTEVADNEIKLQTTCPVMGGAIDKALYIDHDGKRIYICCKGCEAPLKKDAAKYIKKLEDEGITVARLQTECPVMGGAVDKALYVDHDGKRIYVCCQGCVATVKKDPAETIKSMEAAGVALYPAAAADKAVEPKKPAAGHEGHSH
jgi:hypothetical protein